MIKQNVTQVWAQLEAVLRCTFSADERIVWYNLVRSYIDGQCPWTILVDTVRGVRAHYTEAAETPESREPFPSASPARETTRTQILTRIIADDAAQDPAVIGFRDEVLGGVLLDWKEVQDWIRQQQEKEQGRPRMFLCDVPLPPGSKVLYEVHGI